MTTNHKDHPDDNKLSPTDDRPGSDEDRHHKPHLFSGFDEDNDEDFEEPDRDTDYSSGYGADSVEEEDFNDFLLDEDDSNPIPAPVASSQQEPEMAWEEPEPAETEESGEWPEEEDYNSGEGKENTAQDWPLGLITVAVIALLLLAVGGYGVIQQRAATQEEIRELRAALATAASPEDLSASRAALQELKDANAELTATADSLTLYNRRLTDTVTGLEAQLKAQQATLTTAAASEKKPARPAATPKPVTPIQAAPASTTNQSSSGSWFVNFGSYAVPAMAETWASRLKPTAGRVIIAKSTNDGKPIYRVRVVDLTSKDAAKNVALNLEAEMGVSALWVGRE